MCYVEDEANWDGGAEIADAGPVSSRGHHLGRRQDSLVTDHPVFWALGNTPFEREAAYRALLSAGLSGRERDVLEQGVHKGWPLGSARFIDTLAGQTTRRLVPLKRGRPPKPPAAV